MNKDVSQSTNRSEIIWAIQKLNPNVDISLGDPRFVSESARMFYCSVPADKLILPKGFYYDGNNGITNKHNTENGMYTNLKVQEIPKDSDIRLLPKHIKDVSQSTNRNDIVVAIQALNPYADISLGDPHFVSESARVFYSSIPDEYLVLPDGFYYTESNGITNKHNTESGMYTSLRTQEIPKDRDIRLLPKQVKDVSQSTNRNDIVVAIQALNPYADISLGDPRFVSESARVFYSSIPDEYLVLPDGFYYTESNGITNKHNTESGMYTSLRTQEIPKDRDIRLLPKQVKDVSQSTNIYEITKAIQELNPYAEIRIGNMEYDSQATRRFYSSIPAEYLVLPNGFVFNGKNGITNKHNTENGIYCSLDVEDLSVANQSTLIPKVETIVKREIPKSDQEKQIIAMTIREAIQNLKNQILNNGDNNAKSR